MNLLRKKVSGSLEFAFPVRSGLRQTVKVAALHMYELEEKSINKIQNF